MKDIWGNIQIKNKFAVLGVLTALVCLLVFSVGISSAYATIAALAGIIIYFRFAAYMDKMLRQAEEKHKEEDVP